MPNARHHALYRLGHNSSGVIGRRYVGRGVRHSYRLLIRANGGLLSVIWVYFSPIRNLFQPPPAELEANLSTG